MKAIEFSGNVKDDAIKIPKKFLPNLSDESVRVIILVEEQEQTKKSRHLRNDLKH